MLFLYVFARHPCTEYTLPGRLRLNPARHFSILASTTQTHNIALDREPTRRGCFYHRQRRQLLFSRNFSSQHVTAIYLIRSNLSAVVALLLLLLLQPVVLVVVPWPAAILVAQNNM